MKYINLVVVAALLLSCESKVSFKNTVPPSGVILQQIPEYLQGVYYSQCDTTVLYAMPNLIYSEGYYQFVTTIDKLHEKEGCWVADNDIYLKGIKECLSFEYINEDTIRVKVVQRDTLFLISENQVVKEYNGSIFLNRQDENNNWMASRVTTNQDGSLLLEFVDIPNEVEIIREITTDYECFTKSDDEEMFVINPTQIEFETLLSKGYLKECDVYIPLNLEIQFRTDSYDFN